MEQRVVDGEDQVGQDVYKRQILGIKRAGETDVSVTPDTILSDDIGKRGLVELREKQVFHGLPVVLNVAGRAEKLRARAAHPAVHVFMPPVAGGKHDVAPRIAQRERHALVEDLAVDVLGLIAVVVLEVVDAPRGKLLRVVELVLEAARVARAGVRAAARVNAELQPFRVHVVGHGLDAVREFLRVGDEAAVFAALLEAPAVVYDDVLVALALEAAFAQGVGRAADERFVDVPCKGCLLYTSRCV